MNGGFAIDPATLRRNDDPPDYVAFREAAIRCTARVGTKLELSPDQRLVLAQMSDEHDIPRLMEWVGRSNRSKFREAVLAPLLALGLVAMTIPDKPNSSNQRYRLTEHGKALRDEVSE